ncbi:hypothetical protein NFI00_000059 [Salmonella enterica]|nr:hypothetical protein [Salmonella enterica]
MSRFARATTKGNQEVDFTKLRGQLNNVNPMVASTLRNAVPKNGTSPQRNELNPDNTINTQKLERLSNIISNNINAVTDLRQITPYIDKAEIIWSTLMLYPNGQQDKILTYNTQNSQIRNDKLHAELLKTWDNYFTNDYKIERQLRKMLNDILWNTGSYAILNLSRPTLDYLINGSQMREVQGNESYMGELRTEIEKHFVKKNDKYVVRNLGKFVRNPKGNVTTVSGIESLFSSGSATVEDEFPLFQFDNAEDNKLFEMLTITDNPAVLFLQKINEANRQRDVSEVTGVENYDSLISGVLAGKENIEDEDEDDKDTGNKKDKKGRKNLKDDDVKKDIKQKKGEPAAPVATTRNMSMAQEEALQNNIFPHRNPAYQQIQYIKTPDALSVAPYGQGITWHVPSEAVIPIHYNGNSQERLDYIVLLDDEGNFLKNTNDFEYYQSSSTTSTIGEKNKIGSDNHLIASLRKAQEGKACDFDMSEFADMARSSIIKRFLGAAISGKADSISVSLDEETNKIWLARILRRQAVRCLYVPGECMTYMTFKTNNRLGTGQSLTQMAKMHIARLAAYDLADALANIEGAQPHTMMTINVEKEDTDPMTSIAMARSRYFRANPRLHGILATAQLSVPQIVDALREQSLTVKINPGENPHIASPDIDMSQMDKGNFKPVDDQSRQKVLNDIANYFSLPRSWLDVSDDQNNFQIEALAEHQMILNQVVNWQELFAESLIDFQRKHAEVNEPLMVKLIKIIASNKSLWKPDSGEELPGQNDSQKIKMILADFINNVYCEFPRPTSTETTAKLRDSLDAVKDLVDRWEEMAGHLGVMGSMLQAMGVQAELYTEDEIKKMVRSVLYMEAFKRYNLPMPFDEIVGDGKNGGIASLVNSVSFMRGNVAEFLSKFMLEQAKNDKQYKKMGEKINKAFGVEEEPAVDPDNPVPSDGTAPEEEEDPFQTGADETGNLDALETDDDTATPTEEDTDNDSDDNQNTDDQSENDDDIPPTDDSEPSKDTDDPFSPTKN